jgi:hypothetical protein
MFNRYLAWLGRLACRAVVCRMATARRVFSASLTISPGVHGVSLLYCRVIREPRPTKLPNHLSPLTNHVPANPNTSSNSCFDRDITESRDCRSKGI